MKQFHEVGFLYSLFLVDEETEHRKGNQGPLRSHSLLCAKLGFPACHPVSLGPQKPLDLGPAVRELLALCGYLGLIVGELKLEKLSHIKNAIPPLQ